MTDSSEQQTSEHSPCEASGQSLHKGTAAEEST
jgi:hypothetical protein